MARLLARLHSPNDAVFLHVDRASPLGPFASALEALTAAAGPDDPGVRLLERNRVRWGTYGVVRATLAGMFAARRAGCDYVSVISGQDYPIKPVEALRAHLAEADGAAFMLYFALPNHDWTVPEGGLSRLNRRHYRLGRFRLQLPNRWTPFVPKRSMPRGLVPYAGSNWWTLPAACVNYILDFLDERPDVVRFYRRAGLPAESIFQTILLSGPLREKVQFNDLRYIDWVRGGSHPAVLNRSYLPELRRSSGYLARKFDVTRDPVVLDLIDQELLGAAA